MAAERRRPGQVRDAIVAYYREHPGEATIEEIHAAVCRQLGGDVARSSVRSYLNLNTPEIFIRVGRGRYKLRAE